MGGGGGDDDAVTSTSRGQLARGHVIKYHSRVTQHMFPAVCDNISTD